MDPKTVKRIKESPWRPAEEGETYAYRIVLWERAEGEGYPDGERPYLFTGMVGSGLLGISFVERGKK